MFIYPIITGCLKIRNLVAIAAVVQEYKYMLFTNNNYLMLTRLFS